MLHLIPAPLYRRLLRIAHPVRVLWWRWGNPRIVDCRVIALDRKGRVLLVRHSYGSGEWMLPGGAPGRGEAPVDTAVRELREEAGCALDKAIEVAKPDTGARRIKFVVVGRVTGTAMVDGREVIEAGFFKPDALPQPASVHLRGSLKRWLAAYRG